MAGSAHYDGRAVDVFFRPVNADNKRARLGDGALPRRPGRPARIEHVIFDADLDRRYRSEEGWRDYDPGDGPGDRAMLEHRDHVHVDVTAGLGPAAGTCAPMTKRTF